VTELNRRIKLTQFSHPRHRSGVQLVSTKHNIIIITLFTQRTQRNKQ